MTLCSLAAKPVISQFFLPKIARTSTLIAKKIMLSDFKIRSLSLAIQLRYQSEVILCNIRIQI